MTTRYGGLGLVPPALFEQVLSADPVVFDLTTAQPGLVYQLGGAMHCGHAAPSPLPQVAHGCRLTWPVCASSVTSSAAPAGRRLSSPSSASDRDLSTLPELLVLAGDQVQASALLPRLHAGGGDTWLFEVTARNLRRLRDSAQRRGRQVGWIEAHIARFAPPAQAPPKRHPSASQAPAGA